MRIPGQSKPSGWFIDSSVSEPFSRTLCSRSAWATARSAPQPPAGLLYGSKTGPASGSLTWTAGCGQRKTELDLPWRATPDGLNPDKPKFWRGVVASIPNV